PRRPRSNRCLFSRRSPASLLRSAAQRIVRHEAPVSRDEPVYSAHDHGVMIADRARVGAYRRALERTVKPGHVVVDLGTGTGLLAVFACRLGARTVYAIEAEEIIDLARDIAAANGCADRIAFIRGHSTGVQLPERADVVVSDVHGALPMFGRGL